MLSSARAFQTRLVLGILAIFLVFSVTTGQAGAQQRWWIQVESQQSLRDTTARAQIFATRFPETHAFKTHSGWNAIVIGPFSRKEANRLMTELKAAGRIPSDSIVSSGRSHVSQLWPVVANTEVAIVKPEPEVVEPPKPEPEVVEPPKPETAPQETAEPEEPESGPIPDPDIKATRALERTWSRALKMEYQGYMIWTGDYKGAIDGAYGRGTRSAIMSFQEREGFERTGYLTEAQSSLLKQRYDNLLAELGVETLRDVDAGIEVLMPVKVVEFDRFEPPFVHYKPRGDGSIRVDLISQEGGRDVLASLYDIMETFEYIPRGGYRVKKRDWFVLSGRNDDVVSYTYAKTAKGLVKGFTLVWTPETDAQMKQVANAMYQSFVPLDDYVLDAARGEDAGNNHSVDLSEGIDTVEPDHAASGFFVSTDGLVVTHETNVRNCARVTVKDGVEMETLARDSASELALLRPKEMFTPASYALFSREEPTLGTEITVAGFSFPDVMDIAALNYGTLTANAGTKGDETRMRVSAFLEAGDVGGPVLNDRGAVIGMVLLRGSQGTNLPEYVNFAIKTDRILALLNSGNYAYGRSTTREPVDLEDLAFMAGDFTVKVSCWK